MARKYYPKKVCFGRPPAWGPERDRKNYPMDVQILSEGFAYTKGHQDAKRFCAIAERMTGEYYDYAMVMYRWMRKTNTWMYGKNRKEKMEQQDSETMLIDARPGTRGAFPVTCCYSCIMS